MYRIAGDTIAVGSQNGSVYLYRVSRDGFTFKKSNKIRGVQPLVHLDWSTDGHYLQSVTAEYDLVYCTSRLNIFSSFIVLAISIVFVINIFRGCQRLDTRKKRARNEGRKVVHIQRIYWLLNFR